MHGKIVRGFAQTIPEGNAAKGSDYIRRMIGKQISFRYTSHSGI